MSIWRGLGMLLLFCGAVLPARSQEGAELETWVKELSTQINHFRAAEGLAPLELDLELCAFAQAWAEHLGQTGKPEHRGDLHVKMEEFGYAKMNENLYIAAAFPTADRTFSAWRQSAGHRRNLLNAEIRKLGIGAGRTASGKTFIVFNGAG